jgi:hypothetical protein
MPLRDYSHISTGSALSSDGTVELLPFPLAVGDRWVNDICENHGPTAIVGELGLSGSC